MKGIASVDFTDEGNVNMTKEEADKIKNCTAKLVRAAMRLDAEKKPP